MQLVLRPQTNPWPVSVLLGSALLWLLALSLPYLASRSEVPPNSVIEIDFVPWQPPAAPQSPPKAQPKPAVKKTPVEPQPKPVVREPVLAEQVTQEKLPEPTPIQEQPQAEVEQTDLPYSEEALPVPVALAQLSTMPSFLHREQPAYPRAEKLAGREATVKLSVLIDEQGRVRKIDIVQSGGEAFDRAAVAAMKASNFEPARIGGQKVPVRLNMPVKFRLR
ncbi:MAG: TonB family protein [Gammaproteobacteria bacterium]|nr:TonB family protein [Gammaproteobacteria bacterium]